MLAISLLATLTLLCLVFATGNGWDNVLRTQRNDLVFEGRHRDYGAYELRRDYDRRLMFAMFIAAGLVGAGIVVPRVVASMRGAIPVLPPAHQTIVEIMDFIYPPPPVVPPTIIDPPPSGGGGAPTPALPSLIMIDSTAVDPVLPAPTDSSSGGGPSGPPDGPKGPAGGGTGHDLDMDTVTIVPTTMLQEQPAFPGGMDKFRAYVERNFRTPSFGSGSGMLRVAFVVDRDGSASDVVVVGKVDEQLAKEARRLIRDMPKWSPGKMNGHPVKCRYVLPISFDY